MATHKLMSVNRYQLSEIKDSAGINEHNNAMPPKRKMKLKNCIEKMR
jgi:hypothetical protein